MTVVASDDDKDSQEVRNKFSSYLKEFINRNALISGILQHMVKILVS